jgi:flagella basal body P-ring formation protein FlgA
VLSRFPTTLCLLLLAATFTLAPVSDAGAQASNIRATLKADVKVAGPVIKLGDVVELDYAGHMRDEKLSSFVIGRSPRIGYVELIKLEGLKRTVRQAFPQWHDSIIWSGPDRVQIRSAGRVVAFEDIAQRAGEYLRDRMNNDRRKLTMGVSGHNDSLRLPYGKLSFAPRLNTDFISKKMCVWIDAYVDEVFYRSIPVWFDVEIREEVFQAKHNIENRSTIVDAQFVRVERDITDFFARHVPVEQFERPLLLESALTKGDVLLLDNVRPVPAVIGGRKVSILVTEGGVRLQMQGIARQDGEIGDYVQIKPLHGDQLIKVRVIGKQLVEVI